MMEEIKKNEGIKINDNTVKILNENFPSCFTNEGKFDLIRFKELLSDKVDITNEGYALNFLGKSYAKYLTSLEADTLLEPNDKHNELSENISSNNIYISGDNFDSLKHLLHSFRNSIRCIYLDPPYNTGSDGFTYKDKFTFTVDALMEKLNLGKEEAERIIDLTSRGSASHSAWMTFMLPKLLMSRDLLSPDGVIIISIDESEHSNLKLLCDDVFDERNFAGEIIWKNSSKNDQDYISMQHEYILFYVKNKDVNLGDWKEKKEGLDVIFKAFEKFRQECGDDREAIHQKALEWYRQFPASNPIQDSKHYNYYDDINGVYFASDISGPNFGQYVYDVIHPVTGKVVKAPASGWRYPEKTMIDKIKAGTIHFGIDETTVPKDKTYLKNTQYQSLTSIKYKDGRVASKMIEKLLGGKYFSNPKDVDLLATIFKAIGIGDNDIVLDLFSGSASTAHAVMKINAENNSSIRYIQLQIQEEVKSTDVAYKAGYRTIDEIGRNRIEAAARIIKQETNANIDYGYRHFTIKQIENECLDKMEVFNPDVIEVSNNLLEEVGKKTLLTTWLCADGYGMNSEGQTIDLDGYKAFYCKKHLYLIDRHFTKRNVESLIKRYMEEIEFNPEHIVVFAYSFETWTISEVLQRNISMLKESQKQLNIHYDVRY